MTPFMKAVLSLALKDLKAVGVGLLYLLGVALWFFVGAWVGWMLREYQYAVIYYGWPKGFLCWWEFNVGTALIFSVVTTIVCIALGVFVKRYVTAAASVAVGKEEK